MKLILLGAPGSGKSTQAKILTQSRAIPHISTGDIFRENIANNTQLGVKVKEFVDKGLLVPDSLTIDIVKDRLDRCGSGFMLDGFPRNVAQAEALDQITDIDKVINFLVDKDKLISRLAHRRVCKCGKTHTVDDPSVLEFECECGLTVSQRQDDQPETVARRLSVYQKDTLPVVEYYERQGKLIVVDGMQQVESVAETIRFFLDKIAE